MGAAGVDPMNPLTGDTALPKVPCQPSAPQHTQRRPNASTVFSFSHPVLSAGIAANWLLSGKTVPGMSDKTRIEKMGRT